MIVSICLLARVEEWMNNLVWQCLLCSPTIVPPDHMNPLLCMSSSKWFSWVADILEPCPSQSSRTSAPAAAVHHRFHLLSGSPSTRRETSLWCCSPVEPPDCPSRSCCRTTTSSPCKQPAGMCALSTWQAHTVYKYMLLMQIRLQALKRCGWIDSVSWEIAIKNEKNKIVSC